MPTLFYTMVAAVTSMWGSETSSCLRSIVHVLLLLMFKPIEAGIKMYIVFSHVTPTTS